MAKPKLTEEEKRQLSIEQCEKSAALENAMTADGADGIKACFAENGKIDFTARALGLACRYYGLECVRALVECGAKFEFKWNTDIWQRFQCVFGQSIIDRADFSLMLLGDIGDALSGFGKTAGVPFDKEFTLTDGGKREILPFTERLEIIKYLNENSDKTKFNRDELYYFSILSGDGEMKAALKEQGAAVPDNIKEALTKGDTKGVWRMFCGICNRMSNEMFIETMNAVSDELNGEKLYYSDTFAKLWSAKLESAETLEIILEKFDCSKMNKSEVMRLIIDIDNTAALKIAVERDWLKMPKKRDEMIKYASDNKKTECTAYLLDFKNKTADFAAEREKAEKREERELNAAPDSVTALKRIWGFKKQNDGTLCITSYKGTRTDVSVPEYIGKSQVTAIGSYAFSSRGPRITPEIKQARKNITSVKLPESIVFIGEHAFGNCVNLESINLPDGIYHIGKYAFDCCKSLKSVTIPKSLETLSYRVLAMCNSLKSVVIPETVTKMEGNVFCESISLESVEFRGTVTEIPAHCFADCRALKSFTVPEGITKIGYFAFSGCKNLEKITLPNSLRELETQAFSECEKLKSIEIPGDFEIVTDASFIKCPSLEEIKFTGRVKQLRLCLNFPVSKRFEIAEGLEQIEIVNLSEIHLASESIKLPRSLKEIVAKDYYNKREITEESKPGATFIVPKGSYAEEYCNAQGYNYIVT